MINYVKFVRGTPAQYAALIHKDLDTLYFVCEADESTAELYLGSKLIAAAGSSDGEAGFLANLHDVFIDEGLAHAQLLVYDGVRQSWVNKSMDEALSVFIGANEVANGKAGLVPVPTSDDRNSFLRGDGTWAPIEKPNILIIENDDNLSHIVVIDNNTKDLDINKGDIIVIKDKYDISSSYIYNGADWTSLTGAVSADNVIFTGGVSAVLAGQALNSVIEQLYQKIETTVTEETVQAVVSEKLAAASLINSVSSDFTVDENKQLNLNNLPISKIEGLEERLSSVGTWENFS